MQASSDVAEPRLKNREQPSAQADMPPQPGTDGETNKNYNKNASETERRKSPREKKLHEQSGPAGKKSFANLAPSKCGRHDALTMTRRVEACEAELQYADSAVEDFAEALHVGGEWYRAEADTLDGTIETMRVSKTVELTDMRRTNESFRAGIEEELARMQRQAAEALPARG